MNESILKNTLQASTVIVNMVSCDVSGSVSHINPATGYVIAENGVIVTNYHVIKEYATKERYTSLSVTTFEGKTYPVTQILSASESDDLAILQANIGADKLKPLSLGNFVATGTPVYVMSHPQKLFYTLTSGEVASMLRSQLFGKPCDIMTISAAFTIGSSGGPVTDVCGNVVGTVSRINNENGHDTKVAIPFSVLHNLLSPPL